MNNHKNLIRKILREELSVKKGDKLMSTKTIPGSRTAGKIYTVLGTHNTPYNPEEEVMFINDAGRILTFNLSDVKNHFIPFDYDSTSDIFNQLKEELESIKGTPIYHFTTVDNALKILESKELRGTLPSGEYLSLDKRLAKTKHQMSISFTRDKNFKGDQSLAGQSKQPLDVILVLDRNKLKTRYKLEPFNYNSIDDDDFYKTKNKELEERVLNQKIYPVSNYLIDIIYKGNNPKIKEMLERYKP